MKKTICAAILLAVGMLFACVGSIVCCIIAIACVLGAGILSGAFAEPVREEREVRKGARHRYVNGVYQKAA